MTSLGTNRITRARGFTLIEILLSVTLIVFIAGVSIPIYQSYQVGNNLDIATTSIVHALRRAHTLSRAVEADTSWGVHVASGSITLFRGASYAARDTGFDEVVIIPTSIEVSGVTEIVFAKFTGEPDQTGTLTLETVTNTSQTITIHEKGMIDF